MSYNEPRKLDKKLSGFYYVYTKKGNKNHYMTCYLICRCWKMAYPLVISIRTTE